MGYGLVSKKFGDTWYRFKKIMKIYLGILVFEEKSLAFLKNIFWNIQMIKKNHGTLYKSHSHLAVCFYLFSQLLFFIELLVSLFISLSTFFHRLKLDINCIAINKSKLY